MAEESLIICPHIWQDLNSLPPLFFKKGTGRNLKPCKERTCSPSKEMDNQDKHYSLLPGNCDTSHYRLQNQQLKELQLNGGK